MVSPEVLLRFAFAYRLNACSYDEHFIALGYDNKFCTIWEGSLSHPPRSASLPLGGKCLPNAAGTTCMGIRMRVNWIPSLSQRRKYHFFIPQIPWVGFSPTWTLHHPPSTEPLSLNCFLLRPISKKPRVGVRSMYIGTIYPSTKYTLGAS